MCGLEGTRRIAGTSDAIAALFADGARQQRAVPDTALRLQGDPVRDLIRVVSGTLRCCRYTEDGRRQIVCFPVRGEVLGLLDGEVWHTTLEAVDCVQVECVPRAALGAALATCPALAEALMARAAAALAERERLMTRLACRSAPARLLEFLTDLAAARRTGPGHVALPMPRRDISDHLGLTVETVSRAFTTLRRSGAIEMIGTGKVRVLATAPSGAGRRLTPAA